jgi:hypothetical protein
MGAQKVDWQAEPVHIPQQSQSNETTKTKDPKPEQQRKSKPHTKTNKNHQQTKNQNSLEVPNPEPVKIGLRGDSIVSPQVLAWHNEKPQNKAKKPKHQPAMPRCEQKQHSTMRKPGIPPARIPEIT